MTSRSRRELLRLGLTAGLGVAITPLGRAAAQVAASLRAGTAGGVRQDALITRAVPSSGERLAVVGIGTARRYDVGTSAEERAPLREVLARFPELGGSVLDTAPGYGNAELVSGDLIRELGVRDRYFVATKVSARRSDRGAGAAQVRAGAEAQMERSLRRFGTDTIDLMQVWNLSSLAVLLPLVREWKAAGKVRYVGVTTSRARQYDALEALMKREPLDFIQVDYAVDNRNAADRLLPLAADRGIAVLINGPFGRGRVFREVRDTPVPDWAAEIGCTSWAQLFLKWVVAHPAVTSVIPGTATMTYLEDNMRAARGELPDEAMRARILAAATGS